MSEVWFKFSVLKSPMQFELSKPQFLQFGLPPKVETVKTQLWPQIRILRLQLHTLMYRVSYHNMYEYKFYRLGYASKY